MGARLSTIRVALIVLLILVVVPPAGAQAGARQQADLIDVFFVNNFYFSPNGDGVLDNTTVSYDLVDSSLVHLLILESDSTTVVDTLVAGVSQLPTGNRHSATWDGRDLGGAVVTDDTFLVFLQAQGANGTDTAWLKVHVDVTRPQVAVTNVFPSLFAPDSPDSNLPDVVKFDYTFGDPAPSDSIFARATLHDAAGTQIGQSFIDRLVGANSARQSEWNGSGASDGILEFRVAVADRAGNAGQALAVVNVDTQGPSVQSTNLKSNNNVSTPPDSILGWAYDRNGLQALEIKYSAGGLFQPITNTTVRDDTVFFAVSLADSVPGEGHYEVHVRATDIVGRQTKPIFTITVNSTPPNPPIITSEGATVRTSKFIVRGTNAGIGGSVNVYRNGNFATVALANPSGVFVSDVLLRPGTNVLTATVVNQTFNLESGPSNPITVVFDVSAGVTIGQPLRPDEPIILNLGKEASLVDLDIYDLAGDLVATLQQTHESTNYIFRWNGFSGDNLGAKRGPLVAVIRVEYVDGTNEVMREVFLFQP